MAEPQKARLEDVLPYVPETYFSEEEVRWIQTTFKGANNQGVKVIRKLLLPTVHDVDLPIEELGHDTWMSHVDFRSMQSDEVKPVVLARQEAIQFILGALIKLKVIANQVQETDLNRAARREKDSAK